eukprot:275717_1
MTRLFCVCLSLKRFGYVKFMREMKATAFQNFINHLNVHVLVFSIQRGQMVLTESVRNQLSGGHKVDRVGLDAAYELSVGADDQIFASKKSDRTDNRMGAEFP